MKLHTFTERSDVIQMAHSERLPIHISLFATTVQQSVQNEKEKIQNNNNKKVIKPSIYNDNIQHQKMSYIYYHEDTYPQAHTNTILRIHSLYHM